MAIIFDPDWSRAWQANKWGTKESNCIALDVGELDFRPPAEVKRRICEAAEISPSAYCWPRGIPAVRSAIADLYSMNNRPTDGDHIYLSPGAKISLFHIYRALISEGDHVVAIGSPTYRTIISPLRGLHADIEYIPLVNGGHRWEIDLDALRKTVRPDTRLIIINTPHNPTGQMASENELKAIAEVAASSQAIVISDELNEFVSLSASHVSIAALVPEISEKVVTISGFGKGFGIGGYKVGHIIHAGGIMDLVEERIGKRLIQPSTLSQFAAWGCADAAPTWLPTITELLRSNSNRISEWLQRFGQLKFLSPEGGFSYWLELPSGVSSIILRERLKSEAGVALLAADEYVCNSEGLRLSFGCNPILLEEAIQRLENYLPKLLANGENFRYP